MRDVQEANAAKRWFIGTWLAVCAVKVLVASRLPLFVDEAFYWQEGRHLAWAYSDLPGLTAWLARLGDMLAAGNVLALRLPFLLIAAAVPWLMVRMVAREFDAKSGWQAGTLTVLLPLSGTLGLLALPDVPLLLATVLCLDAGLRLLRRVDGIAAGELALGLVIGGLSHYRFAAVIGVGLIVLLCLREGRVALRQSLVWLAVVLGALAWLPLLMWNLDNADAGLRFQLLDRHPWQFSLQGIRLGRMQLLLATPLLLLAMVVAAARAWRSDQPANRFLALSGLLIVFGFLALGFVADHERASFHWPLPGYIALLPLVPAVLAFWSPLWRRMTWGIAALGLAAAFATYVIASVPDWRARSAAYNFHPTNFAGWDVLDDTVRRELAGMPAGARVLAGDFKIGAELGFALGDADIAVLDHPLNHAHGRAPQLAAWGLLHDGEPVQPMLLVTSDAHVKFSELFGYYQRLCEQVGALPPPTVVNVDHGRQRFLLFALPVQGSGATCVTPALAHIDSPVAKARVGKRFQLSAWAVKDVAGVRRVDVLLDGRVVAEARRTGLNTWLLDDFLQRRSRDPGAPNVQFSADVDASHLPAGQHWLGLRIHGGDGAIETISAHSIQLD